MKKFRVIVTGLAIVALLIVGVRTIILFGAGGEGVVFEENDAGLRLEAPLPDDETRLVVDMAVADLAERLGVAPETITVESVDLSQEPEEQVVIRLKSAEAVYVYHGREDQIQAGDPAFNAPTVPLAAEVEGRYADLVEALRAAGATVEAGGVVDQPLFSVPGQMLLVNGQEAVQVFTYEDVAAEDVAAAQQAAARISPDGLAITAPDEPEPVIVEWTATPHFYQQGRMVVLYLGDENQTLEALAEVVGPQFAGGDVEAFRQ